MKIVEFMGTCVSQSIGELAETYGRKFSYKKACKLIKEFDYDMWYSLGLEFYNPWKNDTNLKKDSILHIVHSQTDYLFKIEK
jgi:hypothetical protein